MKGKSNLAECKKVSTPEMKLRCEQLVKKESSEPSGN